MLPTKAYMGKSKLNSAKRLSPVTIETKMPWSSVQHTCVGREIFEVNFVSCTTSHFRIWSFLESIQHDFIMKALKVQIDNQMLT